MAGKHATAHRRAPANTQQARAMARRLHPQRAPRGAGTPCRTAVPGKPACRAALPGPTRRGRTPAAMQQAHKMSPCGPAVAHLARRCASSSASTSLKPGLTAPSMATPSSAPLPSSLSLPLHAKPACSAARQGARLRVQDKPQDGRGHRPCKRISCHCCDPCLAAPKPASLTQAPPWAPGRSPAESRSMPLWPAAHLAGVKRCSLHLVV